MIFLPYLSGELQPINDGHARGLFFGLSMSTGQADLVRAVLEGAAYAIAHNLEIAEELSAPIREIRAIGGPTRSALWCQIIADVCNRPVESAGRQRRRAAGQCAAGRDRCRADRRSWPRWPNRRRKSKQHFQPDADRHEHYRRLFAVYKQLYPNLRDLYVELARC